MHNANMHNGGMHNGSMHNANMHNCSMHNANMHNGGLHNGQLCMHNDVMALLTQITPHILVLLKGEIEKNVARPVG